MTENDPNHAHLSRQRVHVTPDGLASVGVGLTDLTGAQTGTITNPFPVVGFPQVTTVESAVVTIGTTVTVSGINASKPHCFVGVKFFADSGGETPAVPTAGSVVITIQTVNTEPRFEAPVPANTISASIPETIGWSANTQVVRAVPTGIDVATHYRVVVTSNEN